MSARSDVSWPSRGHAESDAFGTLRWGLRRYWWVVVGSVFLVAVLGPLIAIVRPPDFDSVALVIAKQQGKPSAVTLPRYAATLFDQGQVARAVAARFGDDGNVDGVVPDRVSLTADQETIVFQVVAHDPSPTVAADIANVAADAFVLELNAAGPQVGVFEVQSRATPPSAPAAPLASPVLLIPVSLGAGLALGLALLIGLLILRRPVLEPGDVERAVRVPVLGTITLPRATGLGHLDVGDVGGLTQLCRRVLAMQPRSIVLVHAGSAEPARQRLAVAMHALYRRTRPVRLVAAPEVRAAADDQAGDVRGPQPFPHDPQGDQSGVLTVVDGEQPFDVHEARGALTLLVVPTGVSGRELRSAAAEQVAGASRAGIVLVREPRRPRGGTGTATAPAGQQAPEPSTSADNELADR